MRNTRNDDRVFLRYVSLSVTYYSCVNPNSTHGFDLAVTVTGIKIDTRSSCG